LCERVRIRKGEAVIESGSIECAFLENIVEKQENEIMLESGIYELMTANLRKRERREGEKIYMEWRDRWRNRGGE
jgi:hypothetical protein